MRRVKLRTAWSPARRYPPRQRLPVVATAGGGRFRRKGYLRSCRGCLPNTQLLQRGNVTAVANAGRPPRTRAQARVTHRSHRRPRGTRRRARRPRGGLSAGTRPPLPNEKASGKHGLRGFLRGGWLVTAPSLEVRKEKRQSNRRRLEETGGTAGSAGESRGALGRQDRPPRSRAESDECRGARARPRLISDRCSRLCEGRREGELREGMGELRANLHLFF